MAIASATKSAREDGHGPQSDLIAIITAIITEKGALTAITKGEGRVQRQTRMADEALTDAGVTTKIGTALLKIEEIVADTGTRLQKTTGI